MITAVPTMRTLSVNLIDEWSHAAAREASPDGATEAEMALRAF